MAARGKYREYTDAREAMLKAPNPRPPDSEYPARLTCRLIGFDETGVTFCYKDYRRDGVERQQVMTLATDEFIRRFLILVLPKGFHRIRHYGLLAGSAHKDNVALARQLLAVPPPAHDDTTEEPLDVRPPCPCCHRPPPWAPCRGRPRECR